MASARQIIQRGLVANDGQGDSLRQAAQKINENFADLYSAQSGGDSTNLLPSNLALGTDGIVAATNSGANVSVNLTPKGTGSIGFSLRPAMVSETLTTASPAASESIPLTICNRSGVMAVSLANGTREGQIKEFVSVHASGGVVTITPATFGQGTTVALAQKGSASFRWVSSKWFLMSGTYTTIS